MGSEPPEDLAIAAREIDQRYHDQITSVRWDTATSPLDWPYYVPVILRRLWGRLGYEARVAVYVTAASRAQVARDKKASRDR